MKLSGSCITGIILAVVGILALEPLLGRYFLPEAFTEFPGNFIAVLGSLLLIGTGLSFVFWRSRISFLGINGKETWFRILLVSLPVLLLALAEAALIARDRLNAPVDAEDLKARKLMKEKWGQKKYKDIPLVAPARTAYFNVNADGFRTYPLDTPHEGETRVVLLGGSTGFGWGVADRHVIDRYLEKELESRTGRPVKVFNLSVPAVDFATETLILKDFGPRVSPDVAVFYHGANDGLAWFEQTIGRADKSQTLAPSIFSRAALLHYAYKSRVFRLLMETLRDDRPEVDGAEIDVSRAVSQYAQSFEVSREPCASIKCLYLIQPIVFNKRTRSAREVKIYRRASTLFPKYEQMYARYTDALVSENLPDHVDARGAFSDEAGDLFLDYVHVNGEGNRLMAEFIAETLCSQNYMSCS